MWREENTMLMNSNEYLHIVTSLDKGTQPFVVCDG